MRTSVTLVSLELKKLSMGAAVLKEWEEADFTGDFDGKAIDALGCEGLGFLDECELEDVEAYDAGRIVDNFFTLWNEGGFRDSATRLVRKDLRVITAGDMSWGDEPEGCGYQTISEGRDSD